MRFVLLTSIAVCVVTLSAIWLSRGFIVPSVVLLVGIIATLFWMGRRPSRNRRASPPFQRLP